MANTSQLRGGAGRRGEGGHAGATSRRTKGIPIPLANGCLSGTSTVFNEWLIKFQDPKARSDPAAHRATPGLQRPSTATRHPPPANGHPPQAPLMFKNLMIYTFGVIICFGSWQPSTAEQFYAAVLVIVGTNAAAGLCVSLVLKYCDSLVKGFSTSVSVILAMAVSSVLFGFQLTRPLPSAPPSPAAPTLLGRKANLPRARRQHTRAM